MFASSLVTMETAKAIFGGYGQGYLGMLRCSKITKDLYLKNELSYCLKVFCMQLGISLFILFGSGQACLGMTIKDRKLHVSMYLLENLI